MNPNDIIFALDIGTRTVVGIVGIYEKEKFNIIDSESIKHKSRAMLDGQIHDIEAVAEVANEVKCILEERLGIKLTKVAIAAAGRVLKTKQVKIERQIDKDVQINSEIVESLEIEGIQLAQYEIDKENEEIEKSPYYCVGYSIVSYYLNSYVITTLIGHKGKSIGAEILATFLPHTVVDSLYTVVKKINLEVTNITLEPIAAINVAIPKDLRMLNLALVDIGAGTSDIAITKNGSVVAFGMVPTAGDEITEVISQEYLVDFNCAEKIKLSLSTKAQDVKFTDIMGIKHSVKKDVVRKIIEPAVTELAETISEKILEFNQKSTNAVFLVGGGSLIGGLSAKISNKLLLADERVAIRGRDIIQGISVKGKKLSGPEAITPIGIAITALMQHGKDFFYVNVNNSRVRLFNSRKMKVADALIMALIKPEELIGRKGKNLCFTLNGEKKTITGGMGTSAEISVNGKQANLQTEINPADNILLNPATDGSAAVLTINDIVEYYSLKDVNIEVNGKILSSNYVINNDDNITIEFPSKQNIEKKFDSSEEAAAESSINDLSEDEITVTVNKKDIKIKKEGQNSIFVDIFKYIDFNTSLSSGKNVVLKLNGLNAAYTDVIKDGDVIEIIVENK